MKLIAVVLVAACSGPAAPSPAPAAAHLELALPAGASQWSRDGRFVAFLGQGGRDPWPDDKRPTWRRDTATVVDTRTGTSFTVDDAKDFALLPDNVHVAFVRARRLVVLDAATAAPVYDAPCDTEFGASRDGHIAWATLDGSAAYRVHVRDLRSGDEVVRAGLKRDPRTKVVVVRFDGRGHVDAMTGTDRWHSLDEAAWDVDGARITLVEFDRRGPELLPPDPPSRVSDPKGVEEATAAPDHRRFAGTIAQRPLVWGDDGAVLWRGPALSAASDLAFGPDGSLVAVSATGTVWHVDLAFDRLRVGTLAHCEAGVIAFAVGRDGVAGAACRVPDTRTTLRFDDTVIALENDPTTLVATHGTVEAAVASRSAILLATFNQLTEFDVPGGAIRWRLDMPGETPHALSDDGRAYATAKAVDGATTIYLRDAPDHVVGAELGRGAALDLGFSPERTHCAALLDTGDLWILEAATGDIEQRISTPATAIAWDPFGLRIAYYRGRSGLYDEREIADAIGIWTPGPHAPEEHVIAVPPMSPVSKLVWSPDGAHLAGLANGRVLVWTAPRLGEPPREYAFSAGGGVVKRPDGTAALLGNANEAMALVRCVADGLDVPAARCLPR